jgi:hypothetical protein
MKSLLFAAMLLGSPTFAKSLHHEVNITSGPFYIPTTASAFNPLDSDFKSEGQVLVYMDGLNMTVEFPRISLFTTKTVADKPTQQGENYFFTPGNKGIKMRVGIQAEKLTWFFARQNEWSVTIANQAKEVGVPATAFQQMSDEQLIQFAQNSYSELEEGSLENVKIVRSRDILAATGDIYMMLEEQSDDPVKVGAATLAFSDKPGARKIEIQANIEVPGK